MIRVVLGELADTTLAAILRPVSAEWDPVTPQTRRLEIAAGPELTEQCRRIGELPVGSAVITPAGQLKTPWMVHVVVRSVDEPVSVAVVRRGLKNGLRRLAEWGIESVAVAPLGTGAGNLDAEESAREMVPILFDHLSEEDFPATIDVVADSEYERQAFQKELDHYDLPILPDIDKKGEGESSGRYA